MADESVSILDLMRKLTRADNVDANLRKLVRPDLVEEQKEIDTQGRDLTSEDSLPARNLINSLNVNRDPINYSVDPARTKENTSFPGMLDYPHELPPRIEMSPSQEITTPYGMSIGEPADISKFMPKASPVQKKMTAAPAEADLAQTEERPASLLETFNQRLADAQKARSSGDLLATMMLAGEQAAAGIGRRQANKDIAAPIKEMAGRPLQELDEEMKTKGREFDLKKAQAEMTDEEAKRDPNSNISKAMRATLTQMGMVGGVNMKAYENMSASALEKIFPQVVQTINTKMAADSRRDSARELAKSKEERTQDKTDFRQQDFISKEADRLQKTDEYKNIANVEQAVDHLSAAIAQSSATGDVAAIYSFMKALDRNSAVREAEVELARMGQGSLANLRTKVTQLGNSPRIITKEYIQDMKKYMDAIKAGAESKYRRVADQSLKQAKSRGISSDNYELIDSRYGAPAQQLSNQESFSAAQEAGINAVMKKNNISKDEAISALRKAGKL